MEIYQPRIGSSRNVLLKRYARPVALAPLDLSHLMERFKLFRMSTALTLTCTTESTIKVCRTNNNKV